MSNPLTPTVDIQVQL